jgi:hypothetical protein
LYDPPGPKVSIMGLYRAVWAFNGKFCQHFGRKMVAKKRLFSSFPIGETCF